MPFQLFSKAFSEGGWIPELHSCQGADVSPSLEWSGEPADARSFALVVEDPDAPGGTFCHWLLYDIPANVRTLPQGLKPGSSGTSGANDFGRPGYGGPCDGRRRGDAPERVASRPVLRASTAWLSRPTAGGWRPAPSPARCEDASAIRRLDVRHDRAGVQPRRTVNGTDEDRPWTRARP